jgi:hypothetical protein
MLSPRAAALLTPLSGKGFFSNLFTVLDPVAPQIRRLSDEYAGACGVVCDNLNVTIAANTVGRTALVLKINKYHGLNLPYRLSFRPTLPGHPR